MTFNGWRNDNGHFYHMRGHRRFYRRGGLRSRIPVPVRSGRAHAAGSAPTHWLKAGVEFAHGHAALSSVHTQGGFSDWAISREVGVADVVHLRLTRKSERGLRAVRWHEARAANSRDVFAACCTHARGYDRR